MKNEKLSRTESPRMMSATGEKTIAVTILPNTTLNREAFLVFCSTIQYVSNRFLASGSVVTIPGTRKQAGRPHPSMAASRVQRDFRAMHKYRFPNGFEREKDGA